jgi:hypothetical protein
MSWIALLITGLAILLFGLVILALPSTEAPYLRTIGAASIGWASSAS